MILQIGKLPRELKTLTSGHTADKWLNQMQALSFGWDISLVINTLVHFVSLSLSLEYSQFQPAVEGGIKAGTGLRG